jgi:hypothetical protein
MDVVGPHGASSKKKPFGLFHVKGEGDRPPSHGRGMKKSNKFERKTVAKLPLDIIYRWS